MNELREELQQVRNVSNTYQKELTELNLLELREQEIIAESKEMQQVLKTALKLATLNVSTILVMGESGTGKGLLTKFIHALGKWKKVPFVQINCVALPESLLEAELFGYEKRAFTGAKEQGKVGLFEMAEAASFFWMKSVNWPCPFRQNSLNAWKKEKLCDWGGLNPIEIRCTIIAATNINLDRKIRGKKFRVDLFFRLNIFIIRIPPLRERPGDIFEMAHFFLMKYQKTYGVKRRISPRAMKRLLSYKFPGNTRELKNIIKKAVVMSDGNLIDDFLEVAMCQDRDHFKPVSIPPKSDMNRQVLEDEKKFNGAGTGGLQNYPFPCHLSGDQSVRRRQET